MSYWAGGFKQQAQELKSLTFQSDRIAKNQNKRRNGNVHARQNTQKQNGFGRTRSKTALNIYSPVKKIFLIECLATVVLSGIFLIFSGSEAASASLLGGALFAIPQTYFGYKAFSHSGARSIQQILSNFYRGESGKILLIAAGFAIVHRFALVADVLAMYVTFITVLMLNAFLPGLIATPGSHQNHDSF